MIGLMCLKELMLSSILFGWGISTFCAKQVTQEKLTKFINIFELYQIFIHDFLSQNVSITPNHILQTCIKFISTTSTNFYHFQKLSVKTDFTPFFSSSGMHQSHHLVGCQATDTNSLLIYIFKCFALCLFIIQCFLF